MFERTRIWLADLVTGGMFTKVLSDLKGAQTLVAVTQGDLKSRLDATLHTLKQVTGITPSQLEIYATKAATMFPEGKLDISFEIRHRPEDKFNFKIEACKFCLYNYPPLPNEYLYGTGHSWEAAFDKLKVEVQTKLKYKAEAEAGLLKTDIHSTGKGVEALLSGEGKDALQAFIGGEGSSS